MRHFGESDDLVELGANLGFRHPENRPVEEDVLPACQLGMEAGAHLEQAGRAAADPQPALGGLGDAADDLEQGGLAGAVASDQAHDFALPDLRGHVAQRPEFLERRLAGAMRWPFRRREGEGSR